MVLGLFAALPALSIDISAPSLVLLPAALGTTAMVAGLTLSLFMAGFALGQLGGGLLSDRHGRRPVLLAGLACYSLAGIACALAPTGGMLVLARCVQGIGAGACSVQAFAMVQDLFEGGAARSKRSYVTVVFGVVPMFAPALGSVLSDLAGWRAVHASLAIAGGLLLAVAHAGVAESRRARPPASHPQGEPRRTVMRRDAAFVGLTAANALSYACVFAYVAGAPIVIIGQLGWSPAVFAGVFAVIAASLTAGAWTSGRLGRRGVGAAALLGPALAGSAAGAGLLAAASVMGVASGAVLVPLMLVVAFARGIIAPNLQHLAIERRREQAGVASAVVGVSQLLAGAAASAIVAALLAPLGATAVALPMAILSAAALVVGRASLRRRV